MDITIPIRFLRGWRLYNAGEIAGFSEELANDLVTKGIAVLHLPPAEPSGDGTEDLTSNPTTNTGGEPTTPAGQSEGTPDDDGDPDEDAEAVPAAKRGKGK